MKIEDGAGSGILAQVDKNQRLQVKAITQKGISIASHSAGTAHSYYTNSLTLPTSEANILYIKNTGSANMILHKILTSYNGGTSTGGKVMTWRIYNGPTVPTANDTVSVAPNYNQSSSHTSTADFRVWDEVGTGMTVADKGAVVEGGMTPRGTCESPFDGVILLAPGKALLFTVEAEEAGEGSISIQAFFQG